MAADDDDFDPEAYQHERDARDLAILAAVDLGIDFLAIAEAHDLTVGSIRTLVREARKE